MLTVAAAGCAKNHDDEAVSDGEILARAQQESLAFPGGKVIIACAAHDPERANRFLTVSLQQADDGTYMYSEQSLVFSPDGQSVSRSFNELGAAVEKEGRFYGRQKSGKAGKRVIDYDADSGELELHVKKPVRMNCKTGVLETNNFEY